MIHLTDFPTRTHIAVRCDACGAAGEVALTEIQPAGRLGGGPDWTLLLVPCPGRLGEDDVTGEPILIRCSTASYPIAGGACPPEAQALFICRIMAAEPGEHRHAGADWATVRDWVGAKIASLPDPMDQAKWRYEDRAEGDWPEPTHP